MYLAIPLRREGQIVAVVRTSQPQAPLTAALWTLDVEIAAVGLAGGSVDHRRQSPRHAAAWFALERDPSRRRSSRPRPVEVPSTGQPFGGNRHVG